jgi:hypothetical protein
MEEGQWPCQWARRVAGARTELDAQDPWPLPIMFPHLLIANPLDILDAAHARQWRLGLVLSVL